MAGDCVKAGDLIFWRSDDRDEEVNHCGIIISQQSIDCKDPKLRVHNMFSKKEFEGNVETYTVVWFHNKLTPYTSYNHKEFIEEWYEVV